MTLDPIGGSIEVFADLAAKHITQLPVIGGASAVALQDLVAMFSKSPSVNA